MTTHAAPAALTTREKLILLVLLGAGFMLSVDFSILNVAVPEVGAGVGLRFTELPWIASAFALPAAGFTLLFGRLADLFGRRRLFISGIVVLAIASLLGGLATTPEMLLGARALQGLATAMTIPASLSLLTTAFSEGSVRDRVLGMNGAILSAGFTVGALAGGVLVSALSWRAAFLVNVPVAVAIACATPFLIGESSVPTRVKLDLPGAATITGGLLAVVYAVLEKNAPVAIAGVVLLAAFWLIEKRASAPLAPMHVLRRPTVRWGNFAGFIVFSTETATIFLTTLYLQDVLDMSPLATGLIFGVPGLAAVAAGVIAGRLIGTFGYRRVLVAGLVVQGAAVLPLLLLGTTRASLALVVPVLFVGIFAHVSSIVAYTVTATSGLPDDEQGLATGLVSMTQNVAITVGIPMFTALAATQEGSMDGTRLALGVSAAVTVASAFMIWIGLAPRRAPQYR
jgi:MFS family permease